MLYGFPSILSPFPAIFSWYIILYPSRPVALRKRSGKSRQLTSYLTERKYMQSRITHIDLPSQHKNMSWWFLLFFHCGLIYSCTVLEILFLWLLNSRGSSLSPLLHCPQNFYFSLSKNITFWFTFKSELNTHHTFFSAFTNILEYMLTMTKKSLSNWCDCSHVSSPLPCIIFKTCFALCCPFFLNSRRHK